MGAGIVAHQIRYAANDMKMLEPIKLGKVAGIPVALHPICLLYLLVGVVIIATGTRTAEPVEAFLGRWQLACMTVGLMALSVFLHELGHLVTAVQYKIPLHRTILYPFGGSAKIGVTPIPFRPFLMVILAGPLASLVQTLIWLGLWVVTDFIACLWLAQFNGAMALLNLLPIARLDGGNLLKALGQNYLQPQVTALIGFLTATYLSLGFTASGGLALLLGFISHSVADAAAGLLLVGLGVLLQVDSDYVMFSYTPDRLKKLASTPAAALCKQISVQTAWMPVESRAMYGRPQQEATLSFSADSNVPGLSLEKSKQFPALDPWLIYPTNSLLQALYRLEAVQASTLLMVDDHQIIGTISHDQIRQYLITQAQGLPQKPSYLLMLLKSEKAAAGPLHLSGHKRVTRNSVV